MQKSTLASLLLASVAGTAIATSAAAQATNSEQAPSAAANESRTAVEPSVPGTPTSSANVQTGDLDEIVVTAQRRSERLVDVPISVTAITPETMASAGVTITTDLDRVTPGLTMATQASHAQPAIRGVGSALTGPGADNNVAVYIDGVYQSAQSTLFLDFNNVEQIEVLKGPQGTLFGRNATGGAITIKTLDPGFSPEVRLAASYGRFDDLKLTGYVNMPLGEKAAVNVAGLYRDSGGYITNLFDGKKIKGVQNQAVQGKFLLQPTENFQVIFSGYYMDREDQRAEVLAPIGGPITAFLANPSFVVPGPYQTNQDQLPRYDIKVRSANARAELELESGTISAITSYIRYKGALGFDLDQSPAASGFVALNDDSKTFSQEANFASEKFGSLSFVAGLYYYHDDAGRDQPISVLRNGAPFLRTVSNVTTEAWAAYAEANLELTDRLSAIAGLRYSDENKHAEGRRTVGAGPTLDLRDGWDAFTPRVSLRYEITPASNVYATYSKGFKSGVFNVAGLQASSVDPENIDAYEVGFKTSSRGLRFSTSAYYYDYTDLQVQSQLSAATLVYQNAAAATIYGADFDINVTLSDSLKVFGGGAYTHGRYDTFPGALTTTRSPTTGAVSVVGFIDQSGSTTVRTPEFQANVGATFTQEMDSGKFQATSTLSFLDDYFVAADNRAVVPSNAQLSGEISWTTADERWRVSLWGKNLTDEKRILFLTTGAQGDLGSYDLPRTYGVSVAFNWK